MARRRPALSVALSALAGILILASGCVDQLPTSTQLKAPTALSAARSYVSGSYSASIGTEGGTLNFPIGHIVFPAGSVSQTTRIVATVDGRTLSVDFQPHIVFPAGAQPTLVLSYEGVKVDPLSLVVLHVNDNSVLEDVLIPVVDGSVNTATVKVPGFSGYILSADRDGRR